MPLKKIGDADNAGLESRVKQWLDGQGYPLELRTAQEFHNYQAYVVQSEYFTDLEDGNLREIDVRASFFTEDSPYAYDVSFAVECKVSTAKPWIAFVSPQAGLPPEASVVQRPASDNGHRFLQWAAGNPEVQALPLFMSVSTPAFGVTQAFTTGADVAYAAILSATKAALATAMLDNEHGSCSVTFPIIVIDGSLFECSLDPGTNDIALNGTERTTLVWRKPVIAWPHAIVTIVTSVGLAKLVEDAKTTATTLVRLMVEFGEHDRA